ncbi:MAG: preprotein translocase subunit SecG [Rhabdochlamydiaceae bacterium]
MIYFFYTFLFLFVLLCLFLCLIVLIQESKTMGLGASFGGDAGESLFGASTADVLKKITSYLAFAFMASCVVLSIWSKNLNHVKKKSVNETIQEIKN